MTFGKGMNLWQKWYITIVDKWRDLLSEHLDKPFSIVEAEVTLKKQTVKFDSVKPKLD